MENGGRGSVFLREWQRYKIGAYYARAKFAFIYASGPVKVIFKV
jgi:hypothetical protein